MVIFAFNINWFNHYDPKWTEKHLVSVLEDPGSDFRDRAAIWAGYMWGARIPTGDFYRRLKPLLMALARERSSEQRRHVEILSGHLLAGWGSKGDDGERFVSDEEMRGILLDADDEFREQVVWHLTIWTRNADSDSSWPEKLPLFIEKAWPSQKKARTPRIAASLCNLAFQQSEKFFPRVAMAVARVIPRATTDGLTIPHLRLTEGAAASAHPREILELLYAILSEDASRWPYGAAAAIDDLIKPIPLSLTIRNIPSYWRDAERFDALTSNIRWLWSPERDSGCCGPFRVTPLAHAPSAKSGVIRDSRGCGADLKALLVTDRAPQGSL